MNAHGDDACFFGMRHLAFISSRQITLALQESRDSEKKRATFLPFDGRQKPAPDNTPIARENRHASKPPATLDWLTLEDCARFESQLFRPPWKKGQLG